MKKVLLIVLMLVLVAFGASALKYYDYQYTDKEVRSGSYSGTGRFFDFLSVDIIQLYKDNQTIIDFVIYLFIFAGLAKAIFKKSFSEGHAPLTIGLSLALALGIILWQSRTGVSFIEFVIGDAGAVIIIGVVIFLLIALAAKITGHEGLWFSIFLGLTLLCTIILIRKDFFEALGNEWGFPFAAVAKDLIIPLVILTIFNLWLFARRRRRREIRVPIS